MCNCDYYCFLYKAEMESRQIKKTWNLLRFWGGFYFLFLLFLASGCTNSFKRGETSDLLPGDLLFHVVSEGNAITEVTPGMIDHVAILISADSVFEAVPHGGVQITPVDSLKAQEGHWLQARVDNADVVQSIANARRYLGLPYDSLYLADNDAIYCSELVQFAYVDRQGRRLFQPIPMSFHDDSGMILPYWIDFYRRNGMTVPEGQPGTNPGELSQRPAVRILGQNEN